MSEQTENPNPTTAVAVAPKREIRVVQDDGPLGYLMDTAKFEHCFRIAGAMARSSLIPKHLKAGTFEEAQANCFLIVNQAMLWGKNPFAVAQETYEVGGKLGFSGKLIAAVVNASPRIVEKLSYSFNDKTGDDLEITVSGRLEGEDVPRTVVCRIKDVKTNNQMWGKDPHQKLVYTGAIKWGRRHVPEIILGVVTDDDADAIRQEEKDKVYVLSPAPSFQGQTIDIPPTPEPVAAQPKQKAKNPKAHNTAKATTEPPPEKPAEPPQQEPPQQVQPPAEAPATPPAQTQEAPKTDINVLKAAITEKGLTVNQVLQWCKANKRFCELDGTPAVTLEQLPETVLAGLLKNISGGKPLVEAVRAMKDEPVKA